MNTENIIAEEEKTNRFFYNEVKEGFAYCNKRFEVFFPKSFRNLHFTHIFHSTEEQGEGWKEEFKYRNRENSGSMHAINVGRELFVVHLDDSGFVTLYYERPRDKYVLVSNDKEFGEQDDDEAQFYSEDTFTDGRGYILGRFSFTKLFPKYPFEVSRRIGEKIVVVVINHLIEIGHIPNLTKNYLHHVDVLVLQTGNTEKFVMDKMGLE